MRLFDLHCDTLGYGQSVGAAITRNSYGVDIHRGRNYASWTQAFAAFIPDALPAEEARQWCEGMLDTAERWVADTPDFFIVRREEELTASVPACRALLTVENGGALAAEREYLQHLYARGIRLVTLTWNGDNPWGSGCLGTTDGLTAAGVQAVQDLEELHTIVDVSHLNEPGFWQVARLAKKPFVATHSNATAICPHPRNLTDDQFRAIRDAGGVVGLTLYAPFLGGTDLTAVQRHLEHFLSLDGESTVCIGADLDGMSIPEDWDGISVMSRLWQHLADAGYPHRLLDAVFYTNALTFFKRALGRKS